MFWYDVIIVNLDPAAGCKVCQLFYLCCLSIRSGWFGIPVSLSPSVFLELLCF